MFLKLSTPKKIWSGFYRGIGWEIVKWFSGTPSTINWNYYINICIDRIPEKYDPESFWLKPQKILSNYLYQYLEHPIIGSIEMHGGVTFYEKSLIKNFHKEKEIRIIQVGCDYVHYFDEGHTYNEAGISREVQDTIDKLLNIIPDYEMRCRGCGKLCTESELTYQSDTKETAYCSVCNTKWGK